jgi:hypothetical protein
MLAAPAAAVVAAAVVVEPPVLAVVDLVDLPVPALAQVVARRAHRAQLPRLARLLALAKAHLRVLVPLVLAGLPVLVALAALVVVEPVVVPLQRLLSRPSFSAAMARSTR